MKKEIIYSDLDGTLLYHLDNGTSLTNENLDKINSWINEGKLFSIATGRNIVSIQPFLKDYNLNINLPLVLSNGTVVYDYKNKKIIYQETLNKNVINEAINFYLNNKNIVKLALFSPYTEYLYVENINDDVTGYEMKFTPLTKKLINYEEITKLLFIVNPNDDNTYIIDKIKKFETINLVDIIPSGYRYIELVNKGTSKYTAILKALDYMKINNYNLYTIGDFINDLDMVKNATISFAPANALDVIKHHANHIVSHHNENALKDMINLLKKTYLV